MTVSHQKPPLAAASPAAVYEALRERGRAIRTRTIEHLDVYLDEFRRAVEQLGGHVHYAASDADACAYVADLCRRRGARMVAKTKSMLSEEINLNPLLEAAA